MMPTLERREEGRPPRPAYEPPRPTPLPLDLPPPPPVQEREAREANRGSTKFMAGDWVCADKFKFVVIVGMLRTPLPPKRSSFFFGGVRHRVSQNGDGIPLSRITRNNSLPQTPCCGISMFLL